MKKTLLGPLRAPLLGIAVASLVFVCGPTSAQSAQDQLDERYNRALAAGYKALFLCGAIANAERNGAVRTEESVHEWELTGVYSAIDPIVRDLDYSVVRTERGRVAYVSVDWADNMPPRFAEAGMDTGCRLAPMGVTPSLSDSHVDVLAKDATEPAGFTFVLTGRDGQPLRYQEQVPTPLQRILEASMSDQYGEGTRTTAALVRINREGNGLVESARYTAGFDNKTPQRTWSVAKSIAATLVGVAAHRGLLDVKDRTGREEWQRDARRSITVDHLLRMASGRYSDTPGNRTDPLYAGGSTVEETATNWPLIHMPGTQFRYANNDTLMAVKAISDRHEDFDPAVFFKAVGMDHTVAETDWAGDYILSSQVWSTASDLADLGQLHLNDGVLPSGERILPEGWVEYISTPSGPQPDGPFGYGAGWWLMNKSEGIPPDTFAAFGNRGQYVVVVPSRNVVIVRRGEDPAGNRFDIAAFTRDVLAALED
ncbi:MAG: serine hydrolase domain-containing protein [Erythrobacter sp.]|uniref:serine hydrolase domain-containing protein n=1 Tax=Erythrobacter sp. TaxID=1042 RepID=UPI003A89A2B7